MSESKKTPDYYFPPVQDGAPVADTTPVSEGTVPPTVGGGATPPPSAPQYTEAGAASPNKGRAVQLVAVAVAAALIGGVSGAGAASFFANQNPFTTASSSVQGITINNAGEITGVTAVAAKASPSVVTISVSSSTGSGTGSGVIISQDGYVITNNHVATLDGAVSNPTISVQDNDGKIYKATIVGTDPTVDLAVLKIDSSTKFTPIEWADSAKLNVGDVTVALGAPLGLAGTVTTGIISALNRSIQVASSSAPESTTPQQQQGSTPFDFWNFGQTPQQGQAQTATPAASSSISIPVIQTDASINPGNSGGALLDSKGRLIGINVAIASNSSSSSSAGSIGLGFALPSNLAKRVSAEIIANKKATHGVLGAQVSDAATKSGSTQVGAYLEKIVAGGAAEKGGLKQGDVVTEFNGVRVTDASDLTAQVRAAAGGSDATVKVVRDGKTETIKVTLGTL